MLLSVIIVNYQTADLSIQAIESVLNSNGLRDTEYEIIVVDNGSLDNSADKIEAYFSRNCNIKMIRNKENYGFSKANNIAMKIAQGDYILLLNSDTIVEPMCLSSVLKHMIENPQIGALTCRLVLKNGTLDHACKRGFPTPKASLYYFLKFHKIFSDNKKYGKYTMEELKEDQIGQIDALSGAFMLMPKWVVEKVGNLDEAFFMYGEDLDLCYRIKKYGYQIVYFPVVTTIHLKGQSSKKKPAKIVFEFYRAMYIFYRKHFWGKYPWVVNMVVSMGIFGLAVMAQIKNILKKGY